MSDGQLIFKGMVYSINGIHYGSKYMNIVVYIMENIYSTSNIQIQSICTCGVDKYGKNQLKIGM